MSYNKNKRKQPQKEEKFPLGLLLPIIAFLAIIPLITMMHNYNNNLGQLSGLPPTRMSQTFSYILKWSGSSSPVAIWSFA